MKIEFILYLHKLAIINPKINVPLNTPFFKYLLHRELSIQHQRSLEELNDSHTYERNSLEKRDVQNTQEIDMLHRKCRCLTKL